MNEDIATNERGILQQLTLPNDEFAMLWERIFLPEEQKNQLLSQILVEFTLRTQFPSRASIPLHGIVLLVGPPGTGKTSLAKGVASAAAEYLEGNTINFIEVDPHTLTSSALGKTQREIRRFLEEVVTEHAQQGPLIILLDEVETLVADRSKMSMEANPIDVHRATDAMLAGLDNLAARFPQLLFIATSNFEGALDPAFISRADMIFRIERPNLEACKMILQDTLSVLAEKYPPIKKLLKDTILNQISKDAEGLDGRQIRKAVLSACAANTGIAMNPGLLTDKQVSDALKQLKSNS